MGTGPDDYRRLNDAQRQLVKDMGDMFDKMRQKRSRTGDYDTFRVEDVPRLHVTPIATADAIKGTSYDVMVLVVLNVLFFMLSFLMFLKYDVR